MLWHATARQVAVLYAISSADVQQHLLDEGLDAGGTRGLVPSGHRRFLPLNRRLGPLMTRWQLHQDLLATLGSLAWRRARP